MGIRGCLFRVVVVLAVLWIMACLAENVLHYGKLLPGLGI